MRRGLGLLLLTKLGHDLARRYDGVLSEPCPEPLLALASRLDEGRGSAVAYLKPVPA